MTSVRYGLACTMLTVLACGDRPDDNAPEPAAAESVANQAENDLRVDYIEFLTTNMAETQEFYSTAFGWEFTDYGPDYASFDDGRLTGGFTVAPEVLAGGALVVLYAVDLEDVLARVRGAGGRIAQEIFEFPGGRRFHFIDPSGNELAVWSDR